MLRPRTGCADSDRPRQRSGVHPRHHVGSSLALNICEASAIATPKTIRAYRRSHSISRSPRKSRILPKLARSSASISGNNDLLTGGGLPLPAPLKQTERAEAGGEEWESGGEGREQCFPETSGAKANPYAATGYRSSRRSIFLISLISAAHHDLQRIISQWPLQGLRFVPRRTHPNVAFLVGGQDHWHRLRMDRFDDGVRRRRQEAVDLMWTGYRLGLGAPVAIAPQRTVSSDPPAKSRENATVRIKSGRTFLHSLGHSEILAASK